MPLRFRLQVLEAQLNRIRSGVQVAEADLLELLGQDREAAIDALSAGEEFPFVIVGGAVVCSGSLDVTVISRAFERLDRQ